MVSAGWSYGTHGEKIYGFIELKNLFGDKTKLFPYGEMLDGRHAHLTYPHAIIFYGGTLRQKSSNCGQKQLLNLKKQLLNQSQKFRNT